MKFIADSMLGKLARWLRILGYDTIYHSHATDEDLFFKAHLEKRILLTRDTELVSRIHPNLSLYITSQQLTEQLKQVIKKFGLDTKKMIFTRCTRCNNEVQPIAKTEIATRVPDFIYQNMDSFVYCEKCNKIYWPGSHLQKVNQILADIDENLEESV